MQRAAQKRAAANSNALGVLGHEVELARDINGPIDRAIHGAARLVVFVRPASLHGSLGRAAQRESDVNTAQHEHAVLHFDLSTGNRLQPPFARTDPARLQRAAKGAEESSGGRRH